MLGKPFPERLLLVLAVLALAPASASALPQGDDDMPRVYGYLRGRAVVTDGPAEAGPGGADRQGFLNEARVGLFGDAARGLSYRLSVETTDEETIALVDAFASGPLGAATEIRLGRFKAPFLFSAASEAGDTLFSERSFQGALWDERELGVQLSGFASPVSWKVAAFDASDGDGEEYLLVARAVYQLSGKEIQREGIFGSSGPSNVSLAISYAEETGVSDAEAIGGEFYGTEGRWYLHAEYVEYGDGFTAGAVASGIAAPASGLAGTSPYGGTLSIALEGDAELAGRYEFYDDAAETARWSVGLFKYEKNVNVKWGLSYRDQTSDDPTLEGEIFDLSLTLVF